MSGEGRSLLAKPSQPTAARKSRTSRTARPQHYEVGVTLHNLGCLRYRRDEVDEAAQTLRRAYQVKRAALGRHHPDLAITVYAQARCANVLGDRRRAVTLLRKACDLLDGVVSPDQPTLAACRSQLAMLLGPQSRSLSRRRSRSG